MINVIQKVLIIIITITAHYSILASVFDVEDVINKDGTINKKYIFQNGQYFLKEKYKSQISINALTPAETYSQCKDHFSLPPCQGTFKQRYWEKFDYFDEHESYKNQSKPVIIVFWLGAEGPEDGRVDRGSWVTVAQELRAIMVVCEHRNYGQSYITKNNSAADLQTHSSRQALADYSRFINWWKEKHGLLNTRIICVGGSYGGVLAALFRMLYPKDCTVAWSSSGPMRAKFDMFEYMQTVSEVIRSIDSECYQGLKDVFSCTQQIVNGKPGCSASVRNTSQLLQEMRFCYDVDFKNRDARETFYNAIGFLWASNYPATQNRKGCQMFLKHYKNNTIGTRKDPIKAYGRFLRERKYSWGNCPVEDGDDNDNEEEDSYLSQDMVRWIWQTCNEFGYYQSADPTHCMVGCRTWTANLFAGFCRFLWGHRFSNEYIWGRILHRNVEHFTSALTSVGNSCIIFVNGGYDPWHLLGIYQQSQTNPKNTVVFIPSGEHCEDLNSRSKNPEAIEARENIKMKIHYYLDQGMCNKK